MKEMQGHLEYWLCLVNHLDTVPLGETNIQSAGMPEWVAYSDDEFVAKAKAYASDLAALDQIRQGLRPRVLASRLFDAKAFARDMEEAIQGMWRKWCEVQPAAKRK